MEGARAPRTKLVAADASERFRVLGELGRGGKGVVLLALDRLRGETLALKRLRQTSGLDLRQMKREFRAIERIAHENIVKVYELGVDAQGPYILMEALTGTDLLEHCRPSTPRPADSDASGERTAEPALKDQTTLTLETEGAQESDEPEHVRARSAGLSPVGLTRLCAALPQLLSALECLHQSGLVHRDLKPANVFVRQDHVVKLLDFGILGETGSASMTTLQGTAAYVAPEQIRGEAPAPSNDLYALGVVLFEVVTGHLPFNARNSADLLLQHLNVRPLDVCALAPSCPAWLAQLIDALLLKDPNARLTLSQARALCARELGGYVAPTVAASERPLLEREREQAALLDVLDASDAPAFRYIGISGASGLGKSALLGWTRAAVRRRQLTLLESRARYSELVPFNAIDGLIDDLASTLERFPELVADAEGQRLCDQGRAAFPVLGGLTSSAPPPTLEQRGVFDALIELLQRCTRITGSVVLLCDDLQWADADSVSFLERLLSVRPRGITLIATIRDDLHSPAFAAWSRRAAPDLNFALSPLSEQALAHIIDGVARDLGRRVDQAATRRAAAGCDGRPLLAVVSGRVVGSAPAEAAAKPLAWLLAQYAARGAHERLLLSLLTAIDDDASLAQLERVSGLHGGGVEQALSPLLREGLITAAGRIGDQRSYEFGHDLVRSHGAELLGPGAIKRAHALVADDAEQSGELSAAQRVRHLIGAERFARAAEVARQGAAEAERANAFGLAVELYDIAIRHGREGHGPLREARAVALERSGRYLEAAEEWGQLAALRASGPRRDALLQQAKALLAAGDIRQGRTILRRARDERSERGALPEPLTNLIALGRLMLGPRALPGGVRIAAHGVSSAADERDVFLGTMIGYFDPIAGIRHMLRTRRAYREAGNRVQAAEVDYVLAYLALWTSPKQGKTALGERYLRSARQLLGGEVGPAHGRPYALDLMVQGVHALHEGLFALAAQHLDAAIAFYEQSGRRGSFEHLYCWLYRQYAAHHRQDLADWRPVLEASGREIEDGHESALRCHVGIARARLELMAGNLEEARRAGRDTLLTWPQDEPSYQRFLMRLSMLTPDLYVGDGVRARADLQQLLREHARFLPAYNMLGPDLLSHLAMFEAEALRRGVPGASRRKVEGWARRAEQACPMDRHMAMRAAAYAADYAGQPAEALRWLERAERRAREVGQSIDVAVARYQRGLRLGGAEGAALVQSAEQSLAESHAHPLLLQEDPARR